MDIIELPSIKFLDIETKKDIFQFLDKDEISFLNDIYFDLFIENGEFELSEYYRRNDDRENWVSILSKLSIMGERTLEVLFKDDLGETTGYRAYPNGKVKSLYSTLKENRKTIYSIKKKRRVFKLRTKKGNIEHYCETCQEITQFSEVGNPQNERHKCEKCGRIFN